MANKNNLTLHEAMLLVLLERKFALGSEAIAAKELSKIVGTRKLYLQSGNRVAGGNIIRRRAELYPALFDSAGSGGEAVIRLAKFPQH
jgi:hypothetical protein